MVCANLELKNCAWEKNKQTNRNRIGFCFEMWNTFSMFLALKTCSNAQLNTNLEIKNIFKRIREALDATKSIACSVCNCSCFDMLIRITRTCNTKKTPSETKRKKKLRYHRWNRICVHAQSKKSRARTQIHKKTRHTHTALCIRCKTHLLGDAEHKNVDVNSSSISFMWCKFESHFE